MNNEQFEKMREGYNIRVKIIGKRFDSGEIIFQLLDYSKPKIIM